MAIQSYIPSVKATVKVGVAIVIIAIVLRYLPISENIKSMFRI